MAGHRRTRRPDAGDQADTAPATAAVLVVHSARAERIRTTAHNRYSATPGAREKFALAVDYVRAAEAAAFRAGATDLDQLITDAAHDLIALGDELTAALEQQGRHR